MERQIRDRKNGGDRAAHEVASLAGDQGRAQNDVGGCILPKYGSSLLFSLTCVTRPRQLSNGPKGMKRQMRRCIRRIVREHSAQFVWLELRLASRERAKREKAKWQQVRLTASLSNGSADGGAAKKSMQIQSIPYAPSPMQPSSKPMCAPTPIINPGMDG